MGIFISFYLFYFISLPCLALPFIIFYFLFIFVILYFAFLYLISFTLCFKASRFEKLISEIHDIKSFSTPEMEEEMHLLVKKLRNHTSIYLGKQWLFNKEECIFWEMDFELTVQKADI